MKDYKHIYVPTHPRASSNGCVREHILIAEKLIGRFLQADETVHHIDGNRYNNVIENIMVFKTNSDHIKYHKGGIATKLHDGTYMCLVAEEKLCAKCGRKIERKNTFCRSCYRKELRSNVPSREEIESIIWKMPSTKIAKLYKVSDKAVEKWCKMYNIQKPPRGYWTKINARVC